MVPDGPHGTHLNAPLGIAFGHLSNLGIRNYHHFVAQYIPCILAVYASTSRYRLRRKTRYGASG
jgi:hypothetical protein